MKENRLVSVVIPTNNSVETLSLCLRSICRQSYRDIEVIVVDNYSSDNTVRIARKFGARVFLLRGERARAKNFGLRVARGEFVLFIDSDMVLHPRVIEECVRVAGRSVRVAGIVIPERSVGSSFWARVRGFERSFYVGTPIESPRFFRRGPALRVGGFDESVVFYEEATLPLKLEKEGYIVRARVRAPIYHVEGHLRLGDYLRKRLYYARTARGYLRRFGMEHKDVVVWQVSLGYRFALFLRNHRFWREPGLAVSVIVLKLLEYLAAGVGYLTS